MAQLHSKSPVLETPGSLQDNHAGKLNVSSHKSLAARKQASTVIGSIPKSHASQLRVAVSEWRGQRKVEFRECTKIIGEVFYPVGVPLTLEIDKVPQLIALLNKAIRP